MINRGFSGKVKLRFKRAWRGYRPGDEISPPAALREELLRTRTPLGDPVAEVVNVPTDAAAVVASEASAPVKASAEAPAEEGQGFLAGLVPKKGGRGKESKK